MQYTCEELFAKPVIDSEDRAMALRKITFREALTAAARNIPQLLNGDEEVNLTAVAAYCARRGHKVSQPTLYRHFWAEPGTGHKLSDSVIVALHSVFGIPRSILRGEPMDTDLKESLTKNSLQTLLMAERIGRLPPAMQTAVRRFVEELLDQHESSQHPSNVTQLHRKPPP